MVGVYSRLPRHRHASESRAPPPPTRAHRGLAYDDTDAELEPWVQRLRSADRAGHDAYAFFNDDGDGRAPANARRMIELLGEAAVPWPPERADRPNVGKPAG